MSTPILPFAVWQSGTNQNSIPANDNSLRNQILNGLVIGVSNDEAGGDSDGDIYIVGSSPSGAFASFDEHDLAIYTAGNWYAFAPVQGICVNIAGSLNQWDGSEYVAVTTGGGGDGDVVGPSASIDDHIAVFDGVTGKAIKDGGYTIAQLRDLALLTPENVQTGPSYTLVLDDAFKMVVMDNSGANTLTVPPNSAVAFPVGTRIDLSQDGAGQTTIAAGSGVTIRTPETLKLRKQWGKATLIKRATDTWDIEGNLEASP